MFSLIQGSSAWANVRDRLIVEKRHRYDPVVGGGDCQLALEALRTPHGRNSSGSSRVTTSSAAPL